MTGRIVQVKEKDLAEALEHLNAMAKALEAGSDEFSLNLAVTVKRTAANLENSLREDSMRSRVNRAIR